MEGIKIMTKKEECFKLFYDNSGMNREAAISMVVSKLDVTKATAITYYPAWRKEYMSKPGYVAPVKEVKGKNKVKKEVAVKEFKYIDDPVKLMKLKETHTYKEVGKIYGTTDREIYLNIKHYKEEKLKTTTEDAEKISESHESSSGVIQTEEISEIVSEVAAKKNEKVEILPDSKDIPKSISKADKHSGICVDLNNIYKAKNKDYGDSFGKGFAEYGLLMAIIRLEDKLNRIKALYKNGGQSVKGESLVDSLKDLSNYSIMTVIELEGISNE